MSELTDLLAGARAARPRKARGRVVAMIITPVLALLAQLYIPAFVSQFAFLELPLLVTIYFSMLRRSPITGTLIGAGIGLAQDALSHNPLGLFGIVKTLAGYFAAFLSQRFAVDNGSIRFFLCLFLFLFHQTLYWILARTLLQQSFPLEVGSVIVFALLNAAVAVPLFGLLDRL